MLHGATAESLEWTAKLADAAQRISAPLDAIYAAINATPTDVTEPAAIAGTNGSKPHATIPVESNGHGALNDVLASEEWDARGAKAVAVIQQIGKNAHVRTLLEAAFGQPRVPRSQYAQFVELLNRLSADGIISHRFGSPYYGLPTDQYRQRNGSNQVASA